MSTRNEGNSKISEETYRELVEFTRIGNRAVRRAQEENRAQGIPNVYSIGGHIYYERSDGTLTRNEPQVERSTSENSGSETEME